MYFIVVYKNRLNTQLHKCPLLPNFPTPLDLQDWIIYRKFKKRVQMYRYGKDGH
jgi:hypothetical protein